MGRSNPSLARMPIRHSQTLLLNALVLTLSIPCIRAFSAFQLPKIFEPFLAIPNTASTNKLSKPSLIQQQSRQRQRQEEELLNAVSKTQNGKTATLSQQKYVLDLVSKLELEYPPPALSITLSQSQSLEDDTRQLLDGTWFLQYTSPSEIDILDNKDDVKGGSENVVSKKGVDSLLSKRWKVENAEENITTEKYNAKGSVLAGGINVDVSKKPPKQIFDLSNNTVYNEVELDIGKVRVGGRFRLSDKKDNRVVASFQECTIDFKIGIKLDLGFLFKIRSIIVGTDENGWLETTYLSDRIRIGRGNQGSMFVLTRKEEDVIP